MSKFLVPLLLFLCLNCSEKRKVPGFNSDLWKKDKKGCSGTRKILADQLLSESQPLRGMDDDEVIELLGKPEGSNWETRGKKTFYYYTGTGSQCDSNMLIPGPKLEVEFNALGRVDIITERKF